MDITDIYSIELNREKPFDMRINLKDKFGTTLESISVKQNVANETLALITERWWQAIERKQNGQK